MLTVAACISPAMLAWIGADGSVTTLYSFGATAFVSLGPYAPNFPGVRRPALWITCAIEIASFEADPVERRIRWNLIGEISDLTKLPPDAECRQGTHCHDEDAFDAHHVSDVSILD